MESRFELYLQQVPLGKRRPLIAVLDTAELVKMWLEDRKVVHTTENLIALVELVIQYEQNPTYVRRLEESNDSEDH
jgi:hypothetical protein